MYLKEARILDFCQIAYMPYMDTSYFEFGNLRFLPFKDCETKKLFEPEMLSYLEWFFNKHVDIVQNPLNVTIIANKSDIIKRFWDAEIKEMYDTIALLNFLFIWNNSSFSPISSDNFTLYIKNFSVGDKSLGITSGSYVNISTIYSSDVVDKLLFIRPETTPSWNNNNAYKQLIDSEFFKDISKAIISASQEIWFNRILRSIKILNTSYLNTYGIDPFDRILLLATAFEVLFENGTSSQGKFANAIVNAIGYPDDGSGCPNDINIKIEGFARKIYEIRSRYSHGNEVKTDWLINENYGDLFKCGVYAYGLVIKSMLKEFGITSNITPEPHRSVIELSLGLFALMENTKNHELEKQ